MKTFLKIMVAAIVATIVCAVMVVFDASDGAILLTGLLVAGCVSTLLGVFKEAARRERGNFSIKRRSYGQAAVFVGTACLFMGTPKECEDMADDLMHYGQQARVELLTGEEVEFNIL